MKKISLLLLLFTVKFSAFCQNETNTGEAFYMMDANMKGVAQEKAVYFIHVQKIHDSCWQFDMYNINGPMVSSEQYKDEKGQVIHGSSMYYNKKGVPDSSGNFSNGLQDGSWSFNDNKGRYMEKIYKEGTLIGMKDRYTLDSTYKVKDSLYKLNKHIEVESDFPGGVTAWINYLSTNMVYPQRAQNLIKQGTVVVQFIIDTEGHVLSAEIVQSIEYSVDQEAMRLIKNSPVWKPAMLDGKLVKSYKKQPITFKLEKE